MIDDLDLALKKLLERELPSELTSEEEATTPVSITFAAPDSEFPPTGVNKPVIDLFLYDVRENQGLRRNEPLINRRTDGTISKDSPPVFVDCSYIITAWHRDDSTIIDEHKMLSAVMETLIRFPVIPEDFLPDKGPLSQLAGHLVTSALRNGHLQSLAEFWQALGGKPKVALHYTVTVPVIPPPSKPGLPVKVAKVYVDNKDGTYADEKESYPEDQVSVIDGHKPPVNQ